MTRLERLVEMVRELSPEEFDTFAASVEDLRAERWDREIKQDTAEGRLDTLIEGAVEIIRRDKSSAVLMGKDEYDSLIETVHLLSSPANAARLLKAKDDLAAGRFTERSLIADLDR
ncbi:PHD/YefM family antitoxin component YafN of YafNO toxin-antitoxin module [Peteryoungia aggregata LMG 23059]|uniref:Antitoxin n=1 Tax=Peteryoungia aggregata LMG 23059 TaxID=1368425 RepID=A0ABU0G979_9HYPH|nr:type II toxin-antitoxin system Phd/YefM family antitoxin [Peteryoungia aggregata]MDQ0421887.1 PHD/YefM family antitoxin component YafN of YafNO toxin-antitoxin module [Peteryoungia aggregata LMG 23059]